MAGSVDDLGRSLTDEDLSRIGQMLFDRLKPYVDQFVDRRMIDTMRVLADEILAKQRKDVADELVRILFSKALYAPTAPLPTQEKS